MYVRRLVMAFIIFFLPCAAIADSNGCEPYDYYLDFENLAHGELVTNQFEDSFVHFVYNPGVIEVRGQSEVENDFVTPMSGIINLGLNQSGSGEMIIQFLEPMSCVSFHPTDISDGGWIYMQAYNESDELLDQVHLYSNGNEDPDDVEFPFVVSANNIDYVMIVALNAPRAFEGDDLKYRMMNTNPIVSSSLVCTPSVGTIPFDTSFTVTLINDYTAQTRRIAGRINITLASGNSYSNWKSGWTNVAAGSSYETSWNQTIPALGSVIGNNVFTLAAEDVTPSPYNQPPHPPSGDTDTSDCTVTGIAP